MAQDFQTHKEKLYQQLKEQYGKVVYTYTAHLKNAGFLQRDCNRFKWVQIILSAISTGGFVATVIMDEAKVAWVGGIVSTALLVVNGYLKSKDFASEEQKHIDVANSLWSIREDYISVLTDFDALSENEIMEKRELLKDRTAKVYEQFKRIKEVTRQRSKLYKKRRNNSFMKRSWLIFYHSICGNDFICLRSI